MPGLLETLDVRGLLVRQHLGQHVLDPNLTGDGLGYLPAIAGEHPHVEPQRPKLLDDAARLGFGRVLEADQAGQLTVDGHQQRRGAGGRQARGLGG